MTFTVGGNESDTSYASVAYADAYFADRGSTSWTGSNTLKQGALARASDYVKAFFAPRFDPDKVDLTALPDTLLKAVCEYAVVELTSPGGLTPSANDAASTVVTKEKVGPIETSYAVHGAAVLLSAGGTRKLFPVADALIARLLLPSQGLTTVIR